MLPYVAVGIVLTFQIYVTWRLWHDDAYIRSEKAAQTKLVWLLPLLGAVFVFSMLVDEASHLKRG